MTKIEKENLQKAVINGFNKCFTCTKAKRICNETMIRRCKEVRTYVTEASTDYNCILKRGNSLYEKEKVK